MPPLVDDDGVAGGGVVVVVVDLTRVRGVVTTTAVVRYGLKRVRRDVGALVTRAVLVSVGENGADVVAFGRSDLRLLLAAVGLPKPSAAEGWKRDDDGELLLDFGREFGCWSFAEDE